MPAGRSVFLIYMTDIAKKTQAIKLLVNGEKYSDIASRTGLSYKTLKRYHGIINKDGPDAVLSPSRQYYQTAEKVRAAIDVINGRSVGDVARELGASDYTVRRWVERYRQGGIDALKDGRRLRKGRRTVSAEEYDLLSQVKSTINNQQTIE